MEPLRYLALYAEALPSALRMRRAPPTLPTLVDRHFHLSVDAVEAPPLTLPQLYDAGVECGHMEARVELKRRVTEVDAQLEAFRIVRDRAQGDKQQLASDLLGAQRTIAKLQLQEAATQSHAGHLETELARARRRVTEVESSTTWRLSEPVRRAGHRAKIGLALARMRWHGLRRLPQHANLALTILRDQGPRALAGRVAMKLRGRPQFQPSAEPAFRLEERVIPLGFPEAHAPRVSIIVPTYGKPLLTFTCLKSVEAHTPPGQYEVIVIDDAAPEPAAEALAPVVGIRIERNEANLGFIGACNRGATLARGEILVFLNNDTIVTPGWLDRLLAHLDDPRLGLVGAVTNRCGTAAEIPAGYDTYGGLLAFAEQRARSHAGRARELATPTMFCLAMRRATYERLGPLDERFEVGMLEDDDYARRAAQAGLACACAEDVFVHHFGEASFGALVPTGEHARVLEANKRRFEEKWGTPWQPYERRPDPGYDAVVEHARAVIESRTPGDAAVAVVSRGDQRLVDVGAGRRAWHFPPAGGEGWMGHHPADGAAAVQELEAARERGARFLVFPRTAFWWLDFYDELLRRTS